ncbi:MAG: hypothetical protein AAGA90_06815 [Actinomycetota bacterium]
MSVKRWTRSVMSYLPERAADAVARVPSLDRGPHRIDDLALRDFRRPNPVIVHAGTEIAASTASIRRLIGTSQIHAFEPNERLHDELWRAETSVHGVLLAAHPGTAELHVPRYGTTWFDTEASLDHSTAAMFLGERRIAGYRPDRAEIDTLIVSATTLDPYDLAPDLIILDLRRDASSVIRGAMETLVRHRPLLRIDGGDGREPLNLGVAEYVPARYDPGADAVVLEQPGLQTTWWVHPHHHSLLGVPVV